MGALGTLSRIREILGQIGKREDQGRIHLSRKALNQQRVIKARLWLGGGWGLCAMWEGQVPSPESPHGNSLDACNLLLIHLPPAPLPSTLHVAARIIFQKCK